MPISPDHLTDPQVRAFVQALNAGDRGEFFSLLTPDATMSDDGSDRDLAEWTDREIFSSGGHMDVIEESDGGRTLLADYANDTWGGMRTRWTFIVTGDKISRFETGQA
ncbi:nuclear transport factor 2 family protein [Streptomyces sp. P1-3]|uniref:nuclear transport factor 2 family protein n=1 Tax=Streptomyces sp. P1-3 TaxID=3421658 RepID=UPI003D369EB4